MHSLLAVVVSYGGTSQLRPLLAALSDIDGCRVVLMENHRAASHGNLPPGVEVHQGHGNVGYGTAVNMAVARTIDRGPVPEWLFVINSDVTVPAGTREELPKLLATTSADVDVLGFPVRTESGDPGRGTAVLPTRRTNAYTAVRGEAAAAARWPELRYPIGAFFAIRTETFLRLGGFDPSYWMYYEETDLFARLRAAGGRVAWVDDHWHVTHVGGATVGRAGLLYAELGRSAAIYARRHRPMLGRSWPAVHAAQLSVLAVRKLVAGRPHDAVRAARILSGLATGLASPAWEPAARSRWGAAPAAVRRHVGRIGRRHSSLVGGTDPVRLWPAP